MHLGTICVIAEALGVTPALEFISADLEKGVSCKMIHRILLKALGCCITGVVSMGILAYLLFPWDANNSSQWEQNFALGAVMRGALFGLIIGIGWAIKHRTARWRYIGWTTAGWIAWAALPWAFGQMFGLAWWHLPAWWKLTLPLGLGIIGTVIGIVTALESAGVFSKSKKIDGTGL